MIRRILYLLLATVILGGLAGAVLAVLTSNAGLGILPLLYMLFPILGVWLGAAVYQYREYAVALTRALSERVLLDLEAFAHERLGECLEMLGEWKEARSHLERCLALPGFDENRPIRVSERNARSAR